MKKISLLLLLCLSNADLGFAATPAELNPIFNDALRSLGDANTVSSLQLESATVNEARASDLVLSANYQKTGPQNSVRLAVEKAVYAYGDGSAPTTAITGRLDLDFTKTLPRYQINLFVPQLDSLLSLMARQFAKKYGNAVTIKIKTTEKKKDEAGNWASVRGTASFTVDMKKLPAGMAADSVFYQSGSISLNVEVTKGMAFEMSLVTNPAYRGFLEGEAGLKEKLAKVSARDAEVLKEIEELYRRIDKNLSPLVEGNFSPF
ncbi:MAG: hypothetical protein EOP11_15010 [Proteobacteria bacterium]|nr:MAG: hypothetical protein EOP11_15010 [Pseudomonadota bacterium]